MRAIRIERLGGPEVLELKDVVRPGAPAAGEALVRVTAAGVNFIDIYYRTGQYAMALPYIPGLEGTGVVEALGPGVTDFTVGDRVAWAGIPGSYAQYVSAPVQKLVPVLPGVSDQTAAAAMLQGMTAHYLCHDTFSLKPGHICLVHAAAGGVGQLLVQMARAHGARVIALVSTEEKAVLARQAGAQEVIVGRDTPFAQEVKKRTDGRGVDVVYDSVGKATFEESLNCLRPLGMMVLYGGASGPVPPVDPITLSAKGSIFLTRPRLGDYTADATALRARAQSVFNLVTAGKLTVRVDQTYPLERAAQAHQKMEARQTTGKLLLLP